MKLYFTKLHGQCLVAFSCQIIVYEYKRSVVRYLLNLNIQTCTGTAEIANSHTCKWTFLRSHLRDGDTRKASVIAGAEGERILYKREFTELDPNPGHRVTLFAIKRRCNRRVGSTVVSVSTGCPGKCCEDEITVSQFVTAGSRSGLPGGISQCHHAGNYLSWTRQWILRPTSRV